MLLNCVIQSAKSNMFATKRAPWCDVPFPHSQLKHQAESTLPFGTLSTTSCLWTPFVGLEAGCLVELVSVVWRRSLSGQMRSRLTNVEAMGWLTEISFPWSWMLRKMCCPIIIQQPRHASFPLLFVKKCHGRADTAHVTAYRGGQNITNMRKGTACQRKPRPQLVASPGLYKSL